MQASILTSVVLPLALAFIMFGLGLHLRVADFANIAHNKRSVVVALLVQMLLLPAACFFIAKAFGLTAGLAVGLMLLAVSPGGTSANLFSFLFKGDVALNVSLTAINSVLAVVTIPIFVNFALSQFMGVEQYIPLQFKKVIEVIAIVIIPVVIGMLVNAKIPKLSSKLDKPVKILSALILVLLVIAIVLKERANLAEYFAQVGLAALTFNLVSLLAGYWAGKIAKLSEGQSRAIAFEIGVHNSTLAIYLALTVLNNPDMSIAPAVYSIFMFITAALFGWWVNRR